MWLTPHRWTVGHKWINIYLVINRSVFMHEENLRTEGMGLLLSCTEPASVWRMAVGLIHILLWAEQSHLCSDWREYWCTCSHQVSPAHRQVRWGRKISFILAAQHWILQFYIWKQKKQRFHNLSASNLNKKTFDISFERVSWFLLTKFSLLWKGRLSWFKPALINCSRAF